MLPGLNTEDQILTKVSAHLYVYRHKFGMCKHLGQVYTEKLG